MSTVELDKPVDNVTEFRVTNFYIWKDIILTNSELFIEAVEDVKHTSNGSAVEYFDRLKKYMTASTNFEENWKLVAGVLGILGDDFKPDSIRGLYKVVLRVTGEIEKKYYQFKKVDVPRLKNIMEMRVYDLIDYIQPQIVKFKYLRDLAIKEVHDELFNSLNKSRVELNLIEHCYKTFNNSIANYKEVLHAFSQVQNEGLFYRFDVTYSSLVNFSLTLDKSLDKQLEEVSLLDDKQLTDNIESLKAQVMYIKKLALTIPQQESYNIEQFKKGIVVSDVFDVVVKINTLASTIDQAYVDIINQRFMSLMAE